MKIGVIVAMDKELERLEAALGGSKGIIGANEVTAVKCGVGKVNSALGAWRLINDIDADLIISTGVAGGADLQLSIGDVVVSDECRYHDAYCGKGYERGQIMGLPAAFTSPRELVDKAVALTTKSRIWRGLIVSGDYFVDDTAIMRRILASFPSAKAVDMESCSIAQTCWLCHVPFVSFRIISDIPLIENNAEQYEGFWNDIANNSFDVTKEFLEAI